MAARGRSAPAWALAIAAKECKQPSLTLFWTVQSSRRRRGYVSGMAERNKRVAFYGSTSWVDGACITINAGADTSQRYQLAVLLHELAHWNVGLSKDHGPEWQREVVRLYAKHGLLAEVLAGKWYGYECERKAVQRSIVRRQRAAACHTDGAAC